MTEVQITKRPYKFSFSHCPPILHSNLSDAIIAAAERDGAALFQSMSVTFHISEFEEVEKAYQKLGKQRMSHEVYMLCKKINERQ